ncbi:protein unc-50 homolog isoform X2 [Durio zibethinus]|uniref:Protein unc-50 homolog isoform X2 n=1 Tax=Durio zibethinus TaxID=66656 RepID=A0A6P6AF03_DURZI|nr:protein unc-50 homolog isoform X2 [Durio zibethinus]
MLPTVSKTRSSPTASRPNPMFPQYLRRIVKWQQMDIEYTFWQMLHLCTAPKVVYQHTKYHKRMITVLHMLFLLLFQYCFSIFYLLVYFWLHVVGLAQVQLFDGELHSPTPCRFSTNAYLREEAPNSHVVEQRVEWLYAFDVHCNSFFPMFIMLYVIHYFLSPILVAHGFIPELLSNLLFVVAASYYHYLNFLGYDVLPFLERTTFFLYPIGVVIILSPILILSGFNPSRYFMNIYFSQRL